MKKILVFFGMLFMSLAFNPAISTADEVYSSDSELPQFAVELLEKIDQYVVSDENEDRYFDLEAAIANQEGDLVIQAGEAFNSIKAENETSPYARLRIPGISYGNYCGPGNNKKNPIDDLDRACKAHDGCYKWGGNNTTCNKNLCKALVPVIQLAQQNPTKLVYATAAYKYFSCGKLL